MGRVTPHPFPFEHPADTHHLHHEGDQYEFAFANGYGASVIRHEFSYGGPEGLWELAVLNSSGDLCYTTPITSDVIGHLDERAVALLLDQICRLERTT